MITFMADQRNPQQQQVPPTGKTGPAPAPGSEQARQDTPQFQPDPSGDNPAKGGDLADAGSTSDAAVHQLLAQRQIHESNDDEDAVKAVDAQLAELGYTV